MSTPFAGSIYVTDAAGLPVNGALINCYEAGTLSRKAVYTTAALDVAHANPIVAANGRATFYLGSGSYRIRVTDADGVVLPAYDQDNVSSEIDPTTAEDISYTAAGGVERTLQAKLADTISVSDYASIQDAITAAKTSGRPTEIYLNGDVTTTATILVDASNITICGAGSDTSHDVGTQGAGARARIIWAGIAGGTVVRFASPTGASAQACAGGGMRDVYVDCGAVAAIGLEVKSWRRGQFSDLHFNNPTTVGVDLGVVATLGEARDTQNNEFKKISSRHYEVAGGTGGLLRLGGDATANTSLNYFEQLDCQFSNGDAYVFNNSDNNVILRARAFRSGGTGNAIVFNGSNAGAAETARSNIFIQLTTNGAIPIVHRGTDTFTHASIDNSVLLIDYDNGYATPSYGTGASGSWSDTRGIQGRMAFFGLGVGDDITNTLAARTRLSTTGSVHVVNGSSDHVQLSDASNTNRWGVNLDGSGNLRILRIAGTARIKLTLSAVSDYADDTAAAAGGAAVGDVYRTGSALKMRVA